MERGKYDWMRYVDSIRLHYGEGFCTQTNREECTCWVHGGTLERKIKNGASYVLQTDLTISQGTITYSDAWKVAEEVVRLTGTRRSFLDLGAGSGLLSAHLLMRGNAGVGVEIDSKFNFAYLKGAEVEFPFGSKIPYRAILDDVFKLPQDEEFDYVIMNPPFTKTKLFTGFLKNAKRFSNLIFTTATPNLIESQEVNALLDKWDYALFPLMEVVQHGKLALCKNDPTIVIDEDKDFGIYRQTLQFCVILPRKKGIFSVEEYIDQTKLSVQEVLYVPTNREEMDRPRKGPTGHEIKLPCSHVYDTGRGPQFIELQSPWAVKQQVQNNCSGTASHFTFNRIEKHYQAVKVEEDVENSITTVTYAGPRFLQITVRGFKVGFDKHNYNSCAPVKMDRVYLKTPYAFVGHQTELTTTLYLPKEIVNNDFYHVSIDNHFGKLTDSGSQFVQSSCKDLEYHLGSFFLGAYYRHRGGRPERQTTSGYHYRKAGPKYSVTNRKEEDLFTATKGKVTFAYKSSQSRK